MVQVAQFKAQFLPYVNYFQNLKRPKSRRRRQSSDYTKALMLTIRDLKTKMDWPDVFKLMIETIAPGQWSNAESMRRAYVRNVRLHPEWFEEV